MKRNSILQLLMLVALFCLPTLAFAQQASDKEKKAIRALIEELVFVHEKAKDTPLISPRIGGNNDKEYARQFKKCLQAFKKIRDFKEKAFPILIEHLKDKRPSIPFRNHYSGSSVGDACYWNIYIQLQDRPSNYSEYGYQRKGRDGAYHPQTRGQINY